MKNNILKFRNERKWSLEELGQLTGYSPQYLNKLETGTDNKRLNTDLISALCSAFGCTQAELLDEVSSDPRIKLEFFEACATALDRGLAFMGVSNMSPLEHSIAAAMTYNAGVDGGYTVPEINKAYIEKTLQKVGK